MSSSPETTTTYGKFITNATSEEVTRYLDDICSDPGFLCSNKERCGTETNIYTSVDDVNKICSDMEKANICDTQFDECVVNTINLFGEDKTKTIATSFVNIILPITNAFDENSNQKFLRLPALSGSKKPKSKEICNICACMNRFSSSPGSAESIGETSYTSPGQNTCVYPTFIEHYYYPISIQNINSKLQNSPPVKLGEYNLLNKNIIFAHSEDDLSVINLYELLMKNEIGEFVVIKFILDNLYAKDPVKRKELELYLLRKKELKNNESSKGFFYQNITFFYTTVVVLLSFLFFIILL